MYSTKTKKHRQRKGQVSSQSGRHPREILCSSIGSIILSRLDATTKITTENTAMKKRTDMLIASFFLSFLFFFFSSVIYVISHLPICYSIFETHLAAQIHSLCLLRSLFGSISCSLTYRSKITIDFNCVHFKAQNIHKGYSLGARPPLDSFYL